MDAAVYSIRQLTVAFGNRCVLGPLDLQIPRGSFLGIAGPNGSGKTTLLRALTGELSPSSGEVLLEGRPVSRYHPAELARIVGVVPQEFSLDFAFTVEETVGMGRYPHATRARTAGAPGLTGAVAADGPGDPVAAALEATGMASFAERLVTELSGGERQRALIAQTLAQETPVLLLDEPLNNLDINHQLEVMQLLRRLHGAGKTIAVVLHDLNMAAQYCDGITLLDQGRLAAQGTPGDILDPRTILEVFKVRMAVHREGPRPYLTPLWSGTAEALLAPGHAQVHVVAGGGSASEVVEELVVRGFMPTVGIVSVFDTDFVTAQRYELEVVSAPPFEPFPPEAVQEFESHAQQADVIIVAPSFFSRGNLGPLRTALRASQAGKKVIVMASPPIEERDLSGGEATLLIEELRAAGALEVGSPVQAVDAI